MTQKMRTGERPHQLHYRPQDDPLSTASEGYRPRHTARPRRDSGEVDRRGHVDSLDGIRAFAVLSVMAFHLDFVRPGSSLLHPSGGYLGVDVFFVLSGYLITTLLIKEYDKRDGIRFGGFYARRALRLFPALAVLLVVVGLFCESQRQYWWAWPTVRAIPWVVGYVVNWGAAIHHSQVWPGALINTWSLAVEEQFYLVWPLICLGLLRLTRRRRWVAAGLLAAAVCEIWWRHNLAVHGANFERLYTATDTHSDNLLLGCALAFFVSSLATDRRREVWWRYLSYGAAVVGMAAAPYLYLRSDFGPDWTLVWVPACGLATSLILFNLLTCPLPPLRWLLASPPMVWVGKRSYGLYLWHLPVIVIASSYASSWKDPSPPYRISLVLGSLVLCAVSYRFVEQPFLRWKEQLSRRQGAPSLAGPVPEMGPPAPGYEPMEPLPARDPVLVRTPDRAARSHPPRSEATWSSLLPAGYVRVAWQVADAWDD